MRNSPLIWIVGAIALTALIVFLATTFPGALGSDAERANLVRAVALLALVSAGVVMAPRLNLRGALRNAAIWIGIALVIVTLYALRDDFRELAGLVGAELVPSQAVETAPGTVVVRRAADGHFHLDAKVEGTSVRFLVDTGASVVTLSEADARRVGLDPETLRFTQQFSTANGIAWGAPVRLAEIAAGPLRVSDVRAAVLRGGPDTSLLGMSFLERLQTYGVAGDTLTLRR